jgi:hypothetical protein
MHYGSSKIRQKVIMVPQKLGKRCERDGSGDHQSMFWVDVYLFRGVRTCSRTVIAIVGSADIYVAPLPFLKVALAGMTT